MKNLLALVSAVSLLAVASLGLAAEAGALEQLRQAAAKSGKRAVDARKGDKASVPAVIKSSAVPQAALAGVRKVTPAEAKALVDAGIVVLDVRTPEEYHGGHLPGARLYPLAEIQANGGPKDLDKTTPILVQCRSGKRSAAAAELLDKGGWTQVNDLQGGILAWSAAGYPVTPADPPKTAAPAEPAKAK